MAECKHLQKLTWSMKAIKEDKKSGAGGGKDAEVKSSGQQSEQGLPHGMKSLSNGFKQMNSSVGPFAMGPSSCGFCQAADSFGQWGNLWRQCMQCIMRSSKWQASGQLPVWDMQIHCRQSERVILMLHRWFSILVNIQLCRNRHNKCYGDCLNFQQLEPQDHFSQRSIYSHLIIVHLIKDMISVKLFVRICKYWTSLYVFECIVLWNVLACIGMVCIVVRNGMYCFLYVLQVLVCIASIIGMYWYLICADIGQYWYVFVCIVHIDRYWSVLICIHVYWHVLFVFVCMYMYCMQWSVLVGICK